MIQKSHLGSGSVFGKSRTRGLIGDDEIGGGVGGDGGAGSSTWAKVGFRLTADARYLGTLDGHWRVHAGGPQHAEVRDRGACGDTEARTFSHEWLAGC